ncbi:MAG: PAS domain-containing sensor histidine kinase [Ignavibacteriaceae bacterium]
MRTEDLNKKIIETIPQGVLVVNTGSNITFVNNAMASILGYSNEELPGTPLSKYISNETYEDIGKNIPVVNNNAFELHNIQFCKKDGTKLFADLNIQNIIFQNEKLVLITVIKVSSEQNISGIFDKNEEAYRLLFEKTGSGILYCDKDGKVILINLPCAKHFGGSPADFKGKNISEFLPDSIIIPISDVIKTKQYFENEIKLGCDDPVDYYASYQPFITSNGDISGIMVIFRDATKNKKMQKVLRESETRFRRLFEDVARVPVQGYDEDHRVLFWNKASEIAYGYTKEEAMGQKFEDLVIPAQMRTDIFNAVEDFFNKNIPIPSGEIGLKRKDGTFVDMYSNYVIIKNYEGRKEMYSIDVDMSKRIEAEQQVALQARMLNAVGQSVIATNKEGNIIFLNEAAEKLYGWKKSSVLNKNLLSLLPENEIKKKAEEFVRLARKGEPWTGEFIAQKKGGAPFTALGTNSPLFNSCGELIGVIGVSIDITDIKNKEKELKAAKEKAEEMSKVKSAFLANISHELRTPLVGILGFSEILNQELEKDSHKNIASSILLSGRRLLTTLNAILDLSKIEANMMELNYTELSIMSEVKCAVKIFEGLAAKKGLKMVVDDNEDFTAELDKNIFLQVFENLIHNALKFTEQGEIRISLLKESGYFSLMVRDTGIGISREEQNLIFNEFRQASEGYGRHFEGAGIGLTLTRRFVQLMQGVIFVESELNKGTVFTVRFPLKRNHLNEKMLVNTATARYKGVNNEY